MLRVATYAERRKDMFSSLLVGLFCVCYLSVRNISEKAWTEYHKLLQQVSERDSRNNLEH